MNSTWASIIQHTVYRKKNKREHLSPLDLARGMRQLRLLVWRQVKDCILIGTGILCAGFGLESFLLPSKFIDGGATGIALMISELASLPLAIVLVVINIPFVLLGMIVIDKVFAFKATLAIIALALCTAF